ncbi:hypothetical protein TNCV_990251 [Trichonephila clavipes]|nr:hypothetical protein TNCV_990251 [Trichonephila clavipes]
MNRRSPSFQTTRTRFVWRTPRSICSLNASCRLLGTWRWVPYGMEGDIKVVWATCYSAWQDKAAHYVNILGDQVHPFVQTSFPRECPLPLSR